MRNLFEKNKSVSIRPKDTKNEFSQKTQTLVFYQNLSFFIDAVAGKRVKVRKMWIENKRSISLQAINKKNVIKISLFVTEICPKKTSNFRRF